jgi:hypothetical protein
MPVSSNFTASTEEEKTAEDLEQNKLSPYMMFKFSIRSESTRKYYERRLRGFFDYIQFEIEINDAEKRFNNFARHCKGNVNWTLNQIVKFLQFQKHRVSESSVPQTVKI